MTESRPTLSSLHAAYADGADPEETIARVWDRITAVDDPGIFIHLASREEAVAAARALGPFDPAAKPLWGVPFAVKDNIDVAGMPTTAACPDFAYVPTADAAVVARLRAAGAIPIGKTNLDQFATGLVGLRTPYPAPRNAVDPALIPGGSSSGSAVAVAQGIVPFALGTDTAGSGRVPAGMNGIAGLKPSLGALSTRGVVPACRTLDCVSIFAHSVGEAGRVLAVACGFDAADPWSRRIPPLTTVRPLGLLRIGVPRVAERRFFGDTQAEAAYEAALDEIAALGARIEEIPFEVFHRVAALLYEGPWVAERYAAIEDLIATRPEALHPVTREITLRALRYSAVDAFKGSYGLAALQREAEPVLASVDLLCVPTMPTCYTVEEVLAAPIATNSNLGTYTNFVNLLGLCGVTLPLGSRADGRPSSVTLLARDGADEQLVALAATLEGSAVTAGPATPVSSASPRIEIAVVGAHMAGLPLNHELTGIGATFGRAARTRDDYRLFELPGTNPRKPGLLRIEAGRGHAIETEIWSLEPAAFGQFVSRIPAPLCIGTIALADGATVQGFLVEAEAVRDARDVSSFGGWRHYLAQALAG